MRVQLLPAILVSFVTLLSFQLHAQPCTSSRIYQYGNVESNERGYSLVAALDSQSYYLSALYNDGVLLLHLDLAGQILFSRAFDIIPGEIDHGNMIMMDDEGMLAFTGMTNSQTAGGNVFTFRYNPVTDQILWAKEFDTNWERNYGYDIIQLGPGGNYVIGNNPHEFGTNDDFEMIELDKNTGDVVPTFSKVYNLVGSSETMSSIVYHQGYIYGSGRYTTDLATNFMRNTVTKFDPADGSTVWATLGHRAQSVDARLYGTDLVIYNNLIYSISAGDPNGIGGSNWHTYLQCTTLDGEVLWFKEYNVAGGDDVGIEITYHDGGLVALVHQRSANDNFTLFKTDLDGRVLWSSQFPANTIINTQEQLITLGDKLVFTGITRDATGNDDILVVQTDAEGIPDHPCVQYTRSMVEEMKVLNPVFFSVTPVESPAQYQVVAREPSALVVELQTVGCDAIDTLFTTLEASICEGESYEGYTATGVYTDAFTSIEGCDSVRILHLTVDACQPDCGEAPGSFIFGESFTEENAHAITASKFSEAVYIAGNRDNNTLLIKMDYNGQVLWAREFNIIKDDEEVPAGLVEDSDGMVVIVGTGRNVSQGETLYGMRYDPNADIILWSQEYSQSPNDYSFGVIEKGAGGNYLLNNQATHNALNNQYAEVVEIDRTTGTPVLSFAKNYQIIGTETLFEIAYHNGALYGVGRYKDGGTNDKMRNTLVQLDPTDGDQIWVKMGHRAETQQARLYGSDLVIYDNTIFSIYHGDPGGTSITNTKFYIQRTDLNGTLRWVKQYELPGNNEVGLDIAPSDGGLVVLTYVNDDEAYYLFKIDIEGNVQWAKTFLFDGIITSSAEERANTVLIEAGDQLFFTALGLNTSGDGEVVVVRTDLEGNVSGGCIESEAVDIPVNITTGSWYSKDVIQFNVEPQNTPVQTAPVDLTLLPLAACAVPDTLMSNIEISICEGEAFESYTTTGVYQDTFQTAEGCDSIRILTLLVEVCCDQQLATVYGQPGVAESGLSIASSLNNDGYYVAGIRSDSVLIMKFTLNDQLEWSHIINAVAGKREYPVALITDSEGMLALTGMATDNPGLGGNPFIMRFNPYTQTLLWSHEIPSTYELDRVHGLSQNGPGGNYLLSTNPHDFQTSNNDFQIFEINPQTGEPVTGVAPTFRLGNSNYIFDLVRHGEFLYGTGRYSLGVGLDLLRHTIVKLDATTFDEVWTKLGHQAIDEVGRMYGFDLLIDEDFIYTGIYGDPDDISTMDTKLFVQKTSLDGELIWLKEYDLPTATDFGYDMVKSGDGYVIFANHRAMLGELYMFKINGDGELLWAKQYNTAGNSNTVTFNIGGNQLIALNDDLVFTGSVDDTDSGEDILVVHTDGDGNVNAPCVTADPIDIIVTDVVDPDWYDVQVEEFDLPFDNIEQNTQSSFVEIGSLVACTEVDSNLTILNVTICLGESFESFTETGIYQDTFPGEDGCDSIRILRLLVQACEPVVYYDLDACRAYMSDGSIMDYSEFDPEYPNALTCGDVEATNLFRSPPAENKHSCTEGLNGTLAMCISAISGCTYLPGNSASVVMEITFTPDPDSVISLNKLEFYEKAPAIYSWIDGPSGPNNYPRFYGIRILKNGTQIFERHDINTSLTWALQSYNFNELPEFTITGPTTFRIELLPYCPIGNGADVSAWDLEDIRFFASCSPILPEGLLVSGKVSTWNDHPVFPTSLYLSNTEDFNTARQELDDFDGFYMFDGLTSNATYYVRAENNTNVLLGVNTLDLITLQKYLLGKQPFHTLDQYIAADINHNDKINAIDLIDLRKTLLGMQPEFPNNTSWRFGKTPMNMESQHMQDFVETYYIESLTTSIRDMNFMGVKIGDINRDVRVNAGSDGIITRSANPYPISIAEQVKDDDGITTLVVIAGSQVTMEGMQLALDLNQMELVEVVPGALPLTSEFFNLDEQGVLRMSWNATNAMVIADHGTLFTIRVRIHDGNRLSEKINLRNEVLAAEVYTEDETREIQLDVRDASIITSSALQMDVKPNPFRDQFAVSYTVPSAGNTRIEVFNSIGELLYAAEKFVQAGKHQELISSRQIGGTQSMVICRLQFGQETITKKVVRWD